MQVKACQVDGTVRDNSDSDTEKKRGVSWRNDWIQSDQMGSRIIEVEGVGRL